MKKEPRWTEKWYPKETSEYVIYWNLCRTDGDKAVELHAQLPNGDWVLIWKGTDKDAWEKAMGAPECSEPGRVLHKGLSDDKRVRRQCQRFFGIEQQNSGDTQEILYRRETHLRSPLEFEMQERVEREIEGEERSHCPQRTGD